MKYASVPLSGLGVIDWNIEHIFFKCSMQKYINKFSKETPAQLTVLQLKKSGVKQNSMYI